MQTSQAAQPSYFPLEPGNIWIFRAEGRLPGTATVEVTGSTVIQEQTYSEVDFFGESVLLRMSEQGILFEYDRENDAERVWIDFSAALGVAFPSGIDDCVASARIDSRSESVQVPAGSFSEVAKVSYGKRCNDAGINSELFLPGVGPLQHSEDNIAGERQYNLIYARTPNGVLSAVASGFALALDAAVYPVGSPELLASLTLTNTTTQPISLQFPSGQNADLRIRNDRGEVVYTWSADKLFAQVFRTVTLERGERTFVLQAPIANLPPGRYSVEGLLATVEPRQFSASAAFTISAPLR